MNNLNDIFFAPTANQELTYEQILEDVRRYFAEHHASTIEEAGDGNAERAASLLKELMIPYIVKRKYAIEVIEAGGRSVKIPDKFSSPQHAIDVVRRMLNACGMVIDDTMPSVIGFLDRMCASLWTRRPLWTRRLGSTPASVSSTSRRFPKRSCWTPAARQRKCSIS